MGAFSPPICRLRRGKHRLLWSRGSKQSSTLTLALPLTLSKLSTVSSLPLDDIVEVTRKTWPTIPSSLFSPDFEITDEDATCILSNFGMTCEWLVNGKPLPEPLKPSILKHDKNSTDLTWKPRAPVVTIMGHVDHGKTTLLDYLRKSDVAANEAGGITQHIGAFSVTLKDSGKITFLDTPGHAAFYEMRKRGANVTDIVILVIAADDGIMPQTVESIKHAKEAQVPIIVAVNKCDLYEPRVGAILRDLLNHDIQVESLGGDTQSVLISGKTGKNMDQLLSALSVQGEVLELSAPTDGPFEGVVIESKIAQGQGCVATVLVRAGTLTPGMFLMTDGAFCKVKRMFNAYSRSLSRALPSESVEIAGWRALPSCGSVVRSCPSEHEYESRINLLQVFNEQRDRILIRRHSKMEILADKATRLELRSKIKSAPIFVPPAGGPARIMKKFHINDIIASQKATEEFKTSPNELNVFLFCDVSGSEEALKKALGEFPSEKVSLRIIRTGIGHPSATDIDFAVLTKSKVIIFNVSEEKSIQMYAAKNSVELVYFSIIYQLIDRIREMLVDFLPPKHIEKVVGSAVIKALFEVDSGKNVVAGSFVTEGHIKKMTGNATDSSPLSAKYELRVVRNGEILYIGKLRELKHLKNAVQQVAKGMECGILLDPPFHNMQVGDEIVYVSRTPAKDTL